VGYNGRLKILPNPDKVEGDDRSPDFLAFIEERAPAQSQPYKGPQLQPVGANHTRPALPQARNYVEGELVE
jgi:hypothetical protein